MDEVDPDSPPLTAEQLARFRPARDVHTKEFLDAWEAMRQRAVEEQETAGKRWVTLELDADITARYVRRFGHDFDIRINDVLRRGIEVEEASSRIAEPRGEAA